MSELMSAPFVPMMLAINSFLEQQEVIRQPQEYVNLADKRFASSLLGERQQNDDETYEFE